MENSTTKAHKLHLLGMLPTAKAYLIAGHLSPQAAAYVTIFSFLGGVIAIQFVSRLLHHFTPSHVVGCDYSHEEQARFEPHDYALYTNGQNGMMDETTRLLGEDPCSRYKILGSRLPSSDINERVGGKHRVATSTGRLSRQNRLGKQVSKLVLGSPTDCDENDKCHGFTSPGSSNHYAQDCFKTPTSLASPRPSTSASRCPPFLVRNATAPLPQTTAGTEEDALVVPPKQLLRSEDSGQARGCISYPSQMDHRSLSKTQFDDCEVPSRSDISSPTASIPPGASFHAHHHHVPANAFLAIGLQTSIAIALHKLPEGFITFATNHANPKLGFTVFMALFIHNISEGFAMALPLYLALGSRWKSMFWSSLLGGISQPLGAGVAALWFKLAGRHDLAPGNTGYGCMFAITAGVMTSVALSLFTESIGLTHNRPLCIAFAFLGMGFMGLSFALTAS